MAFMSSGAFKLGRVGGVGVYLHWTWFLVAAYEVMYRGSQYSSPVWNILEYLALFGLVLLHELGHSLACRQVGGKADHILLWPLGGVAYVAPPQRPGATLWSIAAGPLVNVLFLPILWGVWLLSSKSGWHAGHPDLYMLLFSIAWINTILLAFNLLPVYPLDGGQILRSLLWYVVGQGRSLVAVTILGFVGVAGLVVLAVVAKSIWFGILAVFMLLNCWKGLQRGLVMARMAKAPRRLEYVCPACKQSPPAGLFWQCAQCGKLFDTFASSAVCPNCDTEYEHTSCPNCTETNSISEWREQPEIKGQNPEVRSEKT